jgi:CBS domain containing-hemolysin-like protein
VPASADAGTGLDMPLSAARILRPVLYAPPSMPALDLLLKMQASRTHMALVIDEYGGTDGLVSIEDVMESIVGDIEDEHDEDETPELHPSGDGGFIAEARASLDAVSEAAGFDFASLPEAEGVDTIGGLVTAAAGRVPNRGEILTGPGEFEFEVLDADPRRIKRLKIWPLSARGMKPPAAPAAAAKGPDGA